MKIDDIKVVALDSQWEGPYNGNVSINDTVVLDFFILRHPGFWTAEVIDHEDDNGDIGCRSHIRLHQENHAKLLKNHGIQCINKKGNGIYTSF